VRSLQFVKGSHRRPDRNTGDDQQRDEWAASDDLVYRDGEGRYGDFHALRHTFISLIVRSGASPKTAQTLARHSTATLTLGRYAHAGLFDLTTAISATPSLSSGTPEPAEVLAATGTDPSRPDRALTKPVRFQEISAGEVR
jgi:hypothetical protein